MSFAAQTGNPDHTLHIKLVLSCCMPLSLACLYVTIFTKGSVGQLRVGLGLVLPVTGAT